MPQVTNLLILLLLDAGLVASTALADGGQLRVSERSGDHRISVFTSPNPLRAGPVDLSVFVQDATTGEAVAETDVQFELTPRDRSQPDLRIAATAAGATNKLFRVAIVELPAPGSWDVRVACYDGHTGRQIATSFTMEVAPPLPRWLSVWPWFSWPIVVVLVFAMHRLLVARRQTSYKGRGSRDSAPRRTFALSTL